MHTLIRFQGLRRRSFLVVAVIVMMLSLLPTAAFASSGGRYRQQQFAPQHQRFNRQPSHANRCVATYKVRRGDTLSMIARHYRVTVRQMTAANRISNPNRIFAGSTLCIPR